MPTNKFVLEICADSLDCAIAAERANADRIELCSDLSVGGITPSAGMMETARARLGVPIHVLIRPRPGDFVYSACEFEAMQRDIHVAKQLGMNGIAVGILDSASRIDVNRTGQLVELARPMSVTFHRAFDCSRNLEQSLERVVEIGADRILTSGPTPKAVDSLPILARLVCGSAGRIAVMPGGGITVENVEQILSATFAREIHSSVGASQAATVAQDRQAYKPLDPAEYELRVRQLTSLLDSLAKRLVNSASPSPAATHRRIKQ